MSKFLLSVIFLLVSFSSKALEITRYVAEGATGDGLTKETPSGDLKKVLDLSLHVESLTVYLEPGKYSLPPLDGPRSTEYKNVSLYGGGSDQIIDLENKSIIEGDLLINGGMVSNVDFRGSIYKSKWEPGAIYGALRVIGCNVFFTKATIFTAEAVNGQKMWLIGIDAGTAQITYFRDGSMAPATVNMWGCNICNGYGAEISGVLLNAKLCKFNNNTERPGLKLGALKGSVVRDCEIIGNKGCGGISMGGLKDDVDVAFVDCIISNNVTTNHHFCSAITSTVPYYMVSCLVANNSAEVTGRSLGYDADNYMGAILLTRRQSRFYNCTFYDNREALLQYKMAEADHKRIENSQFINCVFLGNEKPFLTRSGFEPFISNCATDFGYEIPELEAERNLLRITKENAKMIVDNGTQIRLLPGSPLINAGFPLFGLDIYGNSHQLLGGTDMGCCEYTGEWEKCSPESTLRIYGDLYSKVKTDYEGLTYYAYVNNSLIDEGKVVNFANTIYAGRESLPIEKTGDGSVLTYIQNKNEKYAVLYNLDYSPWGPYEIWDTPVYKKYTGTPPIAEQVNGRWILKEVKPQTTKSTPTATGSKSNRSTNKTSTNRTSTNRTSTNRTSTNRTSTNRTSTNRTKSKR